MPPHLITISASFQHSTSAKCEELLKKPNHRAKYVPSMQESARSADTCVYNAALLRPRGYSGQATHNSKGEQLADIEAPDVKIINS
jgi:hypothetical protein